MPVDYSSFYETYFPRVVHYLTPRVATRQDAEDLASQVFIYCYRNWSSYDPGKASIESWLYMIVRSRWKNYCRDRKTSEDIDDFEGVLPSGDDFAENAAKLDELRRQLAEALMMLTEQQRRIVILRYYKEMTDQEIAAALHMTQTNVRVTAHRALHKLESIKELQRLWGE